MSRDFDKAQEMVWASMEYVKVLGFRLRRTEVQRDDWKKVAQSHADELIKCRQQIDALKKERDGFFVQIQDMRAELDRLLAQLREEVAAVNALARGFAAKLRSCSSGPSGG